jgi:predicted nuclease with TOPRIM domain
MQVEDLLLTIREDQKQIQEGQRELRQTFNDGMKSLSNSIERLVKLEERNNAITENQERIIKTLENSQTKADKLRDDVFGTEDNSITNRIRTLETESPMNKQVQSWVIKALWSSGTVLGLLGLGYLFKHLGLQMLTV